MRRREFIGAVAASTIAWARAASAQQAGAVRSVGVLLGNAEDSVQGEAGLKQFNQTLHALGWIDGQNMHIEYRWAAGDPARMEALAKELVGLSPDVIFGTTTPAIAALAHATQKIPIVFALVSDPVGSGFVSSLPHPGGNITGFINLESSLSGKWIEMLKEILPHVTRVAIIYNPVTAPYFDYYLKPFDATARASGIGPIADAVRTTDDLERAFSAIANGPNAGMAVMPDVFTGDNHRLIVSLAARNQVPTIYPYAFMVTAGGLISYGIEQGDLYRRSAGYVDRILKGAKPSDLPVQLPTRFEMAVNLKTAKALGLTVPPTLLALADTVIE
jgi:putative tryptophan/tyrosine transport system substrate-binding protein